MIRRLPNTPVTCCIWIRGRWSSGRRRRLREILPPLVGGALQAEGPYAVHAAVRGRRVLVVRATELGAHGLRQRRWRCGRGRPPGDDIQAQFHHPAPEELVAAHSDGTWRGRGVIRELVWRILPGSEELLPHRGRG